MELSTLSWKGGSDLGKMSGTNKLYRLTGRLELAVGNKPKQCTWSRPIMESCFDQAGYHLGLDDRYKVCYIIPASVLDVDALGPLGKA